MDKSLIQIFRGDDTDGLGYQSIQGKITTTLDLTGCRAVFRYLGFTQEFNPIPEGGRITITMPASVTSRFPPGLGYASLRVYDSENKVRTFTNRIPVFVTVYAPSECGGEFEVVFNGGNLELEPLKIKSVNGYRIYDGYLEQIIDKATAVEYGLALLFDSRDAQKDGNSGYAATPKAVQAVYDAIIGELTYNYYNAEETDEAIDRIAAYYITADAQGNPFETYSALMNATVFYSGGQRRTPTRNDYCVVLADETHGGNQYRYIYTVNQQGVGQWEAQYVVGGSIELDNTVTRTSTNGVKSNGIWSAIWGALTALPGVSSLYDWCVAQLAGKASTADATLTPIYSDMPTFSEWTFDGTEAGLGYHWEVEWDSGDEMFYLYRVADSDSSQKQHVASGGESDNTVVNFGFHGGDVTATRTRTYAVIGYTLGDQSDKPLQPMGDYAPATNITKSALAQDVQASLGKADTALQTAPVTSVNGKTGAVVLVTDDIDFSVGSGTRSLTTVIESIYAIIGTKAPLASPAFTGTPTAPTPASGDNSTKVATTAFVQAAISGISVTPLAGQTFNFATTQGVMDALKTVIEALGGTVTNVPSTTTSQGE